MWRGKYRVRKQQTRKRHLISAATTDVVSMAVVSGRHIHRLKINFLQYIMIENRGYNIQVYIKNLLKSNLQTLSLQYILIYETSVSHFTKKCYIEMVFRIWWKNITIFL